MRINFATIVYYTVLLYLADCTLGDVRLTSDSDFEELTNTGIVEICVADTFGRVCNTGWANRDASVVCRELGYSPYGIIVINLYSWQLQTFIRSLNSCLNPNSPTMFL